MNNELDRQMNVVRTRLQNWSRKTKQQYPGHLEASVRHAVDRLDTAGLARASEEVVATVTGNRKAARRARKTVEETLRKAQRKAGTRHGSGSGMLYAFGALAVIGLVAVVVIRKAAGPHPRNLSPTPPPAPRDPEPSTQSVDPDLGT